MVAHAAYFVEGPQGEDADRRRRLLQQLRQARDMDQINQLLRGHEDDPDAFLQLLSDMPRAMARTPLPNQRARQQQQRVAYTPQELALLRQQQQQQAAATAAAQRRQAAAAAAAAAAERQRQLELERSRQEEVRKRAVMQAERNRQLQAALLERARRHLPSYDPRSLAQLASSLAASGVQDNEMSEALMSAAQQAARRNPTDAKSVADLLDALHAMRHKPKPEAVEQLLLQQQQQEQEKAWQQAVARQQQQAAMETTAAKTAPQQQLRQQQQPQQQQEAAQGLPLQVSRPEDAARLLSAMSRLGYKPNEQWLRHLMNVLESQKQQQQQQQQVASQSDTPAYPRLSAQQQQQQQRMPQAMSVAGAQAEGDGLEEVEEEGEEEDALAHSLQQEAAQVASSVRALERMGRPDLAHQLRERFQRRVYEAQVQATREQQARAQRRAEAAARQRQSVEEQAHAAQQQRMRQAEEEQRLRLQLQQQAGKKRRAEAEAAAAAARVAAAESETKRRADAEAAAVSVRAAAAEAERRREQEALEKEQRRQANSGDKLREALCTRLSTAPDWQELRVLLYNYEEVADLSCVAAAAGRLADLLAGPNSSAVLGWRERTEVGELLDVVAELGMRQLERASAAEATSLLSSFCALRYLKQRVMVALLRRIREQFGSCTEEQLANALASLASCGLCPSNSWMQAFLERCEARLEHFSPEHLVSLPMALARLNAHPGRSWLGSYLDELQRRAEEVGSDLVSGAVYSVAQLDKPFLAAWRQAIATQQQAEAAAAQRQQAQAQVQMQEPQQPRQEQPQALGNAMASVDEVLAAQDLAQEETMGEASSGQAAAPRAQQQKPELQPLPTMHPRQAEQQQHQPGAATREWVPGAPRANAPVMESVEVDVDTELADEGGADVHLPGSFSRDGLYHSPDLDEFEQDDEEPNLADEVMAAGHAQAEDGAWEEEPMVVATTSETDDARATDAPTVSARSAPAAGGQAQQQPQRQDQRDTVSGDGQHGHAHKAPKPHHDAASSRGPTSQQAKQSHLHAQQQAEQLHPQASVAEVVQPEEEQQQQEEPEVVDPKLLRGLRALLMERAEAVEQYRQEEAQRMAAQQEREMVAAARFKVAQEQLQRLEADFANFKRRTEAEQQLARDQAKAELIKPLLAVADNFERAKATIKPATEGERIVHSSYQALYKDVELFMEQQGLKPVGVEGEMFDPMQHEAVMRDERSDVPDGTITGVLQKGYKLGEVLVRPAYVKVAYS